MNQQPSSRYDALSLTFHWVTALLVTIAFVLGPEHFGQIMRRGIDPASLSDVVWHESMGLVVLLLTVLRLLWVAMRAAPAQIPMAPWMHTMAKLVRLALWTLLLALPLTALLSLGGEGHPLTLLGGVRVDRIPMIADTALAKLIDWGDIHKFLGDATMCLAGVHAAAAIYHHLLLKDGVLRSMLPRGRSR